LGFIYRAHQFWHALTAAPPAEDLHHVREVLSPALYQLFERMQSADQAHCLEIYHRLVHAGERSPELLAAALLHDVGKSRYPLNAWERALAVFGKAFFPDWAARWGRGAPCGWRRPFAVSVQHPVWGAEMVEKAGGHPQTVSLIRRHQEPVDEGRLEQDSSSHDDRLLIKLQRLDNES
jgi:hypothetical protein